MQYVLGELVAFLDEQHVLGALPLGLRLLRPRLRRVLGRGFARQRDVLGDDRAEHFALLAAALTLLREVELANGEEETEDVRIRSVAERAQQRGGRELLLLVDVDVDHVVDVDGELDPRSAERDDARRDQPLAVRVRRLLEHHARRSMQLADDHALGAVDDERAERREQRQLTEIDLLLDDVPRPLDPVHFLVDDELQRRLQRSGVGHVALDALLDGVLRLAERVAHELEREVLVDVGDREQVLEDPLEADVFALMRSGIRCSSASNARVWMSRRWGISIPCSSFPNEICLIDSGIVSPAHRRENGHAPARAREIARRRGGPGTARIV